MIKPPSSPRQGPMDTELLKGTLSLLILSLLSRKDMYGYEISKRVEEATGGALRWKEGSLYPNLHKLEKDGLVVGSWHEEPGQRRRKYYGLTPAGRRALADELASWRKLSRAVEQILKTEVRDE